MRTHDIRAQEAVDALLKHYQQLADQEKAAAPVREAAQKAAWAAGQTKIENLVRDLMALKTIDQQSVTNEMAAAFSVLIRNINKGTLTGKPLDTSLELDMNFLTAMRKYYSGNQNNPAKQNEIAQIANEFMKETRGSSDEPLVVRNILYFDMAVSPPTAEDKGVVIAIVPVVIGDDYKAKVIEKMDINVHFLASVLPPSDKLSPTFNENVHTFSLRAGEKIKPFVIVHDSQPDGTQKTLYIEAHMFQEDKPMKILRFQPIALSQWKEPKMDMGEILDAVGYKPGQP